MPAKAPLLLTVLGLVLASLSGPGLHPRLIWNRTPSVPEGLYLIRHDLVPSRNDLVAFQPTGTARTWYSARGYTRMDWLILKTVAALPPDTVCRAGPDVSINGTKVAVALTTDSNGRQMPAWTGCHELQPGEVFLLASHPRSVDGRYLGIQRAEHIIGIARPLWTWASPA